jgi:hypothetical protein
MLRVLCVCNQSEGNVARNIAGAVRDLQLKNVEIVEVDGAQFHAMDAVVGCDRLAIVDDAAKAAPHYRLVADALEAATDMNLGTPTDIVILAAESASAAPRIVSRIRDLAAIGTANRHDSSLCHTDACDVCIGEKACADKLIVRPETPR